MVPLHCDSEKPRNNLKSYQNISSPKRELNSCLRSFGKLQHANVLSLLQQVLVCQEIQESDSQHTEFVLLAMDVITNNDNLTKVVID